MLQSITEHMISLTNGNQSTSMLIIKVKTGGLFKFILEKPANDGKGLRLIPMTSDTTKKACLAALKKMPQSLLKAM